MFHFTYQTKNLINGKTYIGVHSTNNLNDGYIGCGIKRQSDTDYDKKYGKNGSPFIRAVVKYGYENFQMEPLCFFPDAKSAYEEEQYLVDAVWINNSDNYNVTLGGQGVLFDLNYWNNKLPTIYQFDVDGVLIKEWNSVSEINQQLGYACEKITRCCKGTKIWAYNYLWSYTPQIDYIPKLCLDSQLNKYSFDGSYLGTFVVRDILVEFQQDRSEYLYSAVKGKTKTFKGFIWTRIFNKSIN